ncbi:unnamed protein product [Lactuca virosa]|uniref:SWIM-type domain-containing protein n=1 Tax=Lactuca virosa TaxID=75947 RepID=A0AAU9P8Q7_9ASTR|nr:unnamed protein product [Lactuca virosa]
MLQKAEKWESVVCPASIKKMNKFGVDLRNWNVNPSGPSIFEAKNGFEGYVVDLQRKVCSCRLWDISGIPCVHAQCAILFTGQDLVQSISEWFNVDRGVAVGKGGGKGSKRGGRGSKTSVGVDDGGVAQVEGGGVAQVENEDDTIPEKYLVHLWKAMQDLKLFGYSIEEIKNTLSLTDSHVKQLNDYNDTIEQVLPMSMEYPPQTETEDVDEEIIPETQPEQPESEEEEEEGIDDTHELPIHLRIVKRRRPSERIVKTKLKKIGCVGTSANSTHGSDTTVGF